jgi:hypothetical protein
VKGQQAWPRRSIVSGRVLPRSARSCRPDDGWFVGRASQRCQTINVVSCPFVAGTLPRNKQARKRRDAVPAGAHIMPLPRGCRRGSSWPGLVWWARDLAANSTVKKQLGLLVAVLSRFTYSKYSALFGMPWSLRSA